MLSKAQARAYSKLTTVGQSAYQLQESLATLECLVKMRLADRKSELESIFDPRIGLKYRLSGT